MKTTPYWILLILLLAFPIASWILPSDFYDEKITCLSQSIFDFECMWCEMINALQQLHHFNFADAIFYNSFSPVVYLILLYIWYKWLGKCLINLGLVKKWRLLRKTLEAAK